MRCLLAAALCCLLAATAFAQQSGLPSAPNSVAGGPANQVWATPCSGQGQASFRGLCAADVPGVINVVSMGADPTGSLDSGPAFIAALAAAAASPGGTGIVTCPTGHYKIATTITWTVTARLIGSGRNSCVLLPTGNIDAIYMAPSPFTAGSGYLYAGAMENLRIYRSDNPTAGACIDLNQVEYSTFINVGVDGCFDNMRVQSSLDNVFINTVMGGANNSASGSVLWIFQRGSSGLGQNNSGNKIIGGELVGLTQSGGYAAGLYVANSDGLQITNAHVGFVAGNVVTLAPANTTDPIDNFFMDNVILDTAQSGFVCGTLPGGYGSNLFNIALTGGSSIQNMTVGGISIASTCTALADVNMAGIEILNIFDTGVSISAGKNYNFAGAILNHTNANNPGDPAILLGGTAFGVNLDGAQYYKGTQGGAVGAKYNIQTSGSADDISAINQHFHDAQTADVSLGSSGTHIVISTSDTDQTNPTFVNSLGSGGVYLVSTLPTPPYKGFRAVVTDAVSCSLNGALTGSGSTFCPVIYNGSAWVGD